jgi:hypothetical protein
VRSRVRPGYGLHPGILQGGGGALEEPRPETGPWMPIAWWSAALIGAVCLSLVVGVAGMRSESGGVEAALLAAAPLGFLLGGALGSVPVHLLVRGSTAGRLLAPVGCGCLAGAATLALVFVFFAAVFPAL